MTSSLVLIAAFFITAIYLCSTFLRGSNRVETENSVNVQKPVRQESSLSKQLRAKFAIPEEGGKIAISIDRKSFSEKFDKVYRGLNEALTAFNEACKVFLIVQSSTDEEEKEIATAVEEKVPALKHSHRLLHHEQPLGKVGFLRQLIPHLLIEFDDEMINKLVPHIPNVLKHNLCSSNSVVGHVAVIENMMEVFDGISMN